MSAAADYAEKLTKAITPELKRRLEIIAERRRVTLAAVVVDFLTRGANSPIILGAGANT